MQVPLLLRPALHLPSLPFPLYSSIAPPSPHRPCLPLSLPNRPLPHLELLKFTVRLRRLKPHPNRTEANRTAPHRTEQNRNRTYRTAPHRTAPYRTVPHLGQRRRSLEAGVSELLQSRIRSAHLLQHLVHNLRIHQELQVSSSGSERNTRPGVHMIT